MQTENRGQRGGNLQKLQLPDSDTDLEGDFVEATSLAQALAMPASEEIELEVPRREGPSDELRDKLS